MKTIAELASEYGVHRTTLDKAIKRGALVARQSGDIWLIDEEHESFATWLSTKRGRPRGTRKDRTHDRTTTPPEH